VHEVDARSKTPTWQEVAFHAALALERDGRSAPASEDARSLDWRFLLRLDGSERVLLLGCGLGQATCTLAAAAGEVCVVDTDRERLAGVERRLRQSAVGNASTAVAETIDRLPFPDSHFDLVVAGRPEMPEAYAHGSLEQFAARIRKAIKPGGMAQFSVRNRWSPLGLAAESGSRGGPATDAGSSLVASIAGCRRALRRAGFDDVQVYAPLPLHDGIPLVLLPLDGGAPAALFLRDLCSVFEMVSPEARGRYGWLYTAARAGLRLVGWLRGGWSLKYVVPGFCLLASVEPRMDRTI
jgi:SAM-dependent methyltransferase